MPRTVTIFFQPKFISSVIGKAIAFQKRVEYPEGGTLSTYGPPT